MATVEKNIPVVAGGIGAPVAVSEFAAEKTLLASGVTGPVDVQIGINGAFCTIATFVPAGKTKILVKAICDQIRIDAQSGGSAGVVSVAAERTESRFAVLPAGSPGAPANVSQFGELSTMIAPTGNSHAEISEDGGLTWTQCSKSFTNPGCETKSFSAMLARAVGDAMQIGSQEVAVGAALSQPRPGFVYAPYKTPGGNIYNNLAQLIDAAQSYEGPKYLYVDGQYDTGDYRNIATLFEFAAPVGTFVTGEAVTFSGGAVGTIFAQTGTTFLGVRTMSVVLDSGSPPIAAGNTFTGGTSGATSSVLGTPRICDVGYPVVVPAGVYNMELIAIRGQPGNLVLGDPGGNNGWNTRLEFAEGVTLLKLRDVSGPNLSIYTTATTTVPVQDLCSTGVAGQHDNFAIGNHGFCNLGAAGLQPFIETIAANCPPGVGPIITLQTGRVGENRDPGPVIRSAAPFSFINFFAFTLSIQENAFATANSGGFIYGWTGDDAVLERQDLVTNPFGFPKILAAAFKQSRFGFLTPTPSTVAAPPWASALVNTIARFNTTAGPITQILPSVRASAVGGIEQIVKDQAAIPTTLNVDPGVEIRYDTLVGSFVVGETVTFGGGGTAVVRALFPAEASLGDTGPKFLYVSTIVGPAPVDNETITGGTSGATALVDGAPAIFTIEGVPGVRDVTVLDGGLLRIASDPDLGNWIKISG